MDGQRPGVTIIVDSYNHERFVEATVESALAQDHEPLQVIVIDDGSPDGSWEIIQSFGGRITSILQDNQGQVAACRRALGHAEHDIVIFLDSDDLLDPHAARTVAAAWRDGLAKIQYCLRVIDGDGRADGNVFPKYSAGLTPEKARAEVFRAGSYPDSPTSGNAYDRRFLESVLPLLPRPNGFDGELNGVAPLYGDVVSLTVTLGSYRIHDANAFSQNRLDVQKFADYLRHNEARMAFVRDHYRSKGQLIDDDVLDRDLKYQEYALVVEKLGKPAGDPARRPLRVGMKALLAAQQSPHGLVQKALRAVWIMAVTLSPRKLAGALIVQRFVPGRRWDWITRLVTRKADKRGSQADSPSGHGGLERQRPSSSHV